MPYLKVTMALKKINKAGKQEINSAMRHCNLRSGAGERACSEQVVLQPGPQSQAPGTDSCLQEKLLFLAFDLLFHLLIEVLDLFIIGSTFPAQVTKRERDEMPLSPSGALGGVGDHGGRVSQGCRVSSPGSADH